LDNNTSVKILRASKKNVSEAGLTCHLSATMSGKLVDKGRHGDITEEHDVKESNRGFFWWPALAGCHRRVCRTVGLIGRTTYRHTSFNVIGTIVYCDVTHPEKEGAPKEQSDYDSSTSTVFQLDLLC
jgi:hypothetical protein